MRSEETRPDLARFADAAKMGYYNADLDKRVRG
jgi:hypothetical protein